MNPTNAPTDMRAEEAAAMRDIIVNLTPGRPQDPASAFAISLAAAFNAHLTAPAFALEPEIPPVTHHLEPLHGPHHCQQET